MRPTDNTKKCNGLMNNSKNKLNNNNIKKDFLSNPKCTLKESKFVKLKC